MFLLRRLPDKEVMIASEYTNQSGAYKSSRLSNPNFNVLRVPKNSSLATESLQKIMKSKYFKEPHLMNSNKNGFMKIFQSILRSDRYKQLRENSGK